MEDPGDEGDESDVGDECKSWNGSLEADAVF
jgi:hypothetical protein